MCISEKMKLKLTNIKQSLKEEDKPPNEGLSVELYRCLDIESVTLYIHDGESNTTVGTHW